MIKRPGSAVLRHMVAFCMLVALLVSCESRDRYAGVYEAQAKGTTRQGTVVLELKATGDGSWRIVSPGKKDSPSTTQVEGEVPFTWYVKHGHLRIHTKEGGVIVGKTGHHGAITINLPGSRTLVFKKKQ